jgi:site-specific recombinase XerD
MPAASGKEGTLLSEAEVQRLLLAASERAPTGVRNRALIALLYCSGMRLGEALALRPAELDLAAATASVRGPRARAAHVFPAAQPYLETWLAVRQGQDPPARAPLFCTLAGAPLEPAYVRAMLARLGRRAGLAKRVHAHLLRHSCAARLGRAGLAAAALAQQLGHRAVRSTRRALAGFGVALASGGARRAAELPYGLAPEPGRVRALILLGARAARAEPIAAPAGGARVVVRRWLPPELA